MDNRVRSFVNADGKEIQVVDRQARHWFFILYSDNESHLKALEKFKQDVHSLILCHDRSYDPATGELKKKHWHCIYRNFNQSDRTYMFTVLDSIGLDVSNAHLFKTLKELQQFKRAKRFTLESYIVYLTHILIEDKETYKASEFDGDLLNIGYAMKVVARYCPEQKSDNVVFVMKMIDDYFNHDMYLMYDEFMKKVIDAGLFDLVYGKWNFYKSLIDQRNELHGH